MYSLYSFSPLFGLTVTGSVREQTNYPVNILASNGFSSAPSVIMLNISGNYTPQPLPIPSPFSIPSSGSAYWYWIVIASFIFLLAVLVCFIVAYKQT